MIPLSMVSSGERVEIVMVNAGRGLNMKLAAMGLYPGTTIEVVSDARRGPLIISKEGMRFALSLGMAHKILVRPIGGL
ncbi:MAG: FeoA family protein [bacterium]|jgi:Fe2+ transport system protein FeoA